jgi:hypothetical protein
LSFFLIGIDSDDPVTRNPKPGPGLKTIILSVILLSLILIKFKKKVNKNIYLISRPFYFFKNKVDNMPSMMANDMSLHKLNSNHLRRLENQIPFI